MFLVYQTQLEIALKVALRYSRVEELKVAILRSIRDYLSRFKQQTKITVPNETTERRGGRRLLLHNVTCANTSLIEEVFYQGIDKLKAILDRIVIHTTEQ